MPPKKRESELVRLVMPDATPAEIEAATERWFRFLEILNDIAQERAAKREEEQRANAQPPRIPPTTPGNQLPLF
jgi:hypothetical protein